MKKLHTPTAVGALALLALTTGCTAATARTVLPLPTTGGPTALPTCVPNVDAGGVPTFGPNAVQVKWENDLGCDLVPPHTLTVVIDEQSWAVHSGSTEGWGGDASLAWADQELHDQGCQVTWHDGTWAEDGNCDY